MDEFDVSLLDRDNPAQTNPICPPQESDNSS